jgi:hypothetical protein
MLGERGLDLARRSEVECVMRQYASKAGVRGRSDAHLQQQHAVYPLEPVAGLLLCFVI